MKRTPLLLASLSAALALAGGWAWMRWRAAGDPVRFSGDPAAVQDFLAERGRARGELGAGGPGEERLLRAPMPREDAERLFSMPSQYFEYDAHTYYRYRGPQDGTVDLEDLPEGRFRKRVSADGWREDFERLPARRDLLVVAAGDSHTDGLCENARSFANVLEADLAARRPGLQVEVLNTGVTGYSFYHYLGVLEKLLPERPDAFVVAFYSGNDFMDVVRPWHYFHGTAPPPRRADYWERLDAVTRVSNAAVANAFNQLLFFRFHPDQVELALAGATQASLEIARLCEQHGVRLIFVHIPVGVPVEGELPGRIEEARRVLGAGEHDLRQFGRLADRLIGTLRDRSIEVIDLREHFVPDVRAFYWSDLHINHEGHRRLAELLRPRIEAACLDGARRPGGGR